MAGGCPLTAVRRTRSFCIGRATEGRSFYVQIKDQFRPTWRSYAGPPQQRRISVPVDGDSLGSKYQESTDSFAGKMTDLQMADIRHTVFPIAGGFRRLRRPGSIVRALRAERWVRPGNGFTFRAGSEGSYICRRQAAIYSSPARAIPQPSGRRPVKL